MIETKTGLKYFDKRQSDGSLVRDGAFIVVHYIAALSLEALDKGPWLENTWTLNQPVGFRLGDQQLIPGVQEGIQGMKVAMYRRLVIPPSLAFGQYGVPEKVPPNSPISIELYVVEIK